jgi:4-amino-4-deoxy-L-arabinose transferase-like glycosyltransferase
MISSQNTKYVYFGFYLLLILGIVLRILKLGAIPVGLNADEASIGYEAYSLLKTGKDRWGLTLPPYFLSFGSGQNTLYAYLSVPFLYFFDLSQTSIRLLSAVMGLLTVPLVYTLAKTISKNTYFALGCTILFLFDPYQFMIARWALEINILPFFVILSILLFTKAFDNINSNAKLSIFQKVIIIASFPTLALIVYTYASAIFVVPFFIILLLIFYFPQIKKQLALFGLSFGIMLFLLIPFILFILKNNVFKADLSIEAYLPFEIPKMLSSREQIFKGFGANLSIIKKNLTFIFSGFKETDRVFNTTKFYNAHLFLFFAAFGLIHSAYITFKKLGKQYTVLLFWGLTSLIPFLFFEMNLNRSVHLQAIVPIFTAIGIFIIFESISDLRYKKFLLVGLGLLFLIQSSVFYGEYFLKFPKYDQFPKNFDKALQAAEKGKLQNEKTVITSNLMFNYLYVGFYQKLSPEVFHKTLKANFTHSNVAVHSFNNYFILGDNINQGYYLNQDVFEIIKKDLSFVAVLSNKEDISKYQNDNTARRRMGGGEIQKKAGFK